MTRDDIKTIMKYLNTAYPDGYKGVEDPSAFVDVWLDVFADADVVILRQAVKNHVKTNKFQPTISEVQEQIDLIMSDGLDVDMWHQIHRAISNGTYGAAEEFEKLPEVCQRFLGGPSALRDLAQVETGKVNTVVKGQFLKQAQAIKEHERVAAGLPMEVRALIAEAKEQQRMELEYTIEEY